MDRELVIRAQRGDQEAFATIVVGFGRQLHGLAQRVLRDVDLAEDATQRALVSIWRDLPRLRDVDRFEAWCYRLVINACHTEGRRARRSREGIRILPLDVQIEDDATGMIVNRDELERGFRRLSIDHRVVLKPKQFDEWAVHPNLWVLLAARPSTKKSPVLNEIARFPAKADAEDAARYAEEEIPERLQLDTKNVPLPRQRIIRDTTSEALVDLLSHQDTGTTLLAHELSGWIGAMDKYAGAGRGAQADRGIWLQAYDGGPFSQHRIKGRLLR